MTKNEENMSIKYAVCVLETIGNGLTLSNENDREDACVLAIQALEEIQQYRAIGTVEGYERAIQSSIENYNLYREYKAKVQEFEAIGTIEEFKALKKKSVAKKPTRAGIGYKCVCCGSYTDPRDWHSAYCGRCGQKTDWSDCKLPAN